MDDVVEEFIKVIFKNKFKSTWASVKPIYNITVGNLADQIYDLHSKHRSLEVSKVGKGLIRRLYSTYMSYLPTKYFSYEIPGHRDARGTFVEFIKTEDRKKLLYRISRCNTRRALPSHKNGTVLRGEALLDLETCIQGKFRNKSQWRVPTIVNTIPGWYTMLLI